MEDSKKTLTTRWLGCSTKRWTFLPVMMGIEKRAASSFLGLNCGETWMMSDIYQGLSGARCIGTRNEPKSAAAHGCAGPGGVRQKEGGEIHFRVLTQGGQTRHLDTRERGGGGSPLVTLRGAL